MAIAWTPRLAVGVPQIDEEHQELFRRVNRLLEAMQAAKGKEQLEPLIAFLATYVEVHFAGEQALMKAHRYPGAADHLAQHAYFIGEFQALAARVREEGPSVLLDIKFGRLLCDWLRDHVSSTDRKLGEFLRSSGAPPRG